MVDGESKWKKERLNYPRAMAFHRGTQDLYIADYHNNVIRKLNSKSSLSTVHGETVGDPWRVQGFGTGYRDSGTEKQPAVKEPVAQGSKISFPAQFKGPTNVMIATDLKTERRLIVSDTNQKLAVLDIYHQQLDKFCSSQDGETKFVCSQATGAVKRAV